ncbi:iron permease FTR1 family-domain-containing protein [Naematelia encephala]|uniref:Iron permease FTR1 family-domain-containing protein n=1 Tax=Naematelia encephala TaxID=71784 RepID=A0A1Y2BFZ3_9TREE|nr:iron permease FTR1 family-domain-containing protein [Naematelia encephala]
MTMVEVFSPAAFFITMREALETGLIIAVLMGFINQIVPPPTSPSTLPSENQRPPSPTSDSRPLLGPQPHTHTQNENSPDYGSNTLSSILDADRVDSLPTAEQVGLLADADQVGLLAAADGGELRVGEGGRKGMIFQVWTGAVLGGLIACIIGAVFLYAFYHFTNDLWVQSESLWEGCFCALAAAIADHSLSFHSGLAFLRLPHAQVKWRLKLLSSYRISMTPSVQSETTSFDLPPRPSHSPSGLKRTGKGKDDSGRWILFGLPFITVLREGLEGIVFIGGIGMSGSPRAIAGGALVGIIVGGIISYLLFRTSSHLALRHFATTSTILLYFIGAGLATRAAYNFERQYFINGVGTAAAEAGTGPGSYRVQGNIWKLDYGDPEPGSDIGGGGWQVLNSLVGWTNIGTWWTVSVYCLYWLALGAILVQMKWKEGRTAVLGQMSKRGKQRKLARQRIPEDEEEELEEGYRD